LYARVFNALVEIGNVRNDTSQHDVGVDGKKVKKSMIVKVGKTTGLK
jgi:hypothetical protein